MAEFQTLCSVIDGDKILLKLANRGPSKGKWNSPGGKFEGEETKEECVYREVLEETGLEVSNTLYHGMLHFHLNGGDETTFSVHLFSTRSFKGEPRGSDAGEVKWFNIAEMPFGQMWPDDEYWMPLMLRGKMFDADFYLDKTNSTISRYNISLK